LKLTKYPKTSALCLLRAYKWAISPIFPPSCRYTPTCSEYAAEAIERYGLMRGSAMAVWRLLRCHPFVRGGYDPVPIGTDTSERVSPVESANFVSTEIPRGLRSAGRARVPVPTRPVLHRADATQDRCYTQ
jgi:hypothetical protein